MNIFDTLKISGSALKAQRVRLDTISSNLANIDTTRTPEGGPYRKRDVLFKSVQPDFARTLDAKVRDSVKEVQVSEIRPNERPFQVIYDPSHPDADDKGMVHKPNINLMEETVDMMNATRAYEANVTAIKAAKRMALKALEIGR